MVVRGDVADYWGYSPPTGQTLESEETETVSFNDFSAAAAPLTYADIAMIVLFKPTATFFPTRRKVFRFKTVKQADGNLRLEPQPPGDALEIYDRVKQNVRF